MQLRDQIGQRHINKAAAGHHQEIRQPVVQGVDQHIAHRPAQSGDGPGHRHLDDGRLAAAAALAQHGQVAHVVRNFVRQHGQCRDHAQAHVGDEGRGDQDAIAKAMHAVARQHGPLTAQLLFGMVSVCVAVRFVAMT